ncbi:MAG: zinc ribbon domain-containing protein [bacterium]
MKTSINQDKSHFYLKELIRCPYCASTMTPNFCYSKEKKYFYYRCTKLQRISKDQCKYGSVPARAIEWVAVDRLKFLFENDTTVNKIRLYRSCRINMFCLRRTKINNVL